MATGNFFLPGAIAVVLKLINKSRGTQGNKLNPFHLKPFVLLFIDRSYFVKTRLNQMGGESLLHVIVVIFWSERSYLYCFFFLVYL